ncbi:MAG: diguanylate cyclase [Micrococcales bacterium 32-70-13]|nr:MAG: diguanylate cyclase [Micrococcales bacterium 32-70-13]
MSGSQPALTRAQRGGRGLRSLMSRPAGFAGVTILLALAVVAGISVSQLSGLDPLAQDAPSRLLPPSTEHLMGTDQFGRDVFARVSAGLANSALISMCAVAFAAIVGTVCGLLAGYTRGWVDLVIGGGTNVLFAFPPLLLALTLASVLDRNWFTVAIAIGVVYVPIFVRVTRGPVLSLREVEFVRAARSTGMSASGIMFRHVMPNITSIIIVQVALSLSWAVLTEASLSFLGIGAPPPAPSLGSMIFEARTLVTIAPWTLFAPGAVIVLFVVGLNLLGDGLRDTLDPRMKGQR